MSSPPHTVIHTQPYTYMAYLRNKLWTIETSSPVKMLLSVNQFHLVAVSYDTSVLFITVVSNVQDQKICIGWRKQNVSAA